MPAIGIDGAACTMKRSGTVAWLFPLVNRAVAPLRVEGVGGLAALFLEINQRIKITKKLGRLHLQCSDNLKNVDQREVVIASLNATHVTAVNAAGIAKSFLRIALLFSLGTHCFTELDQFGNFFFVGSWRCYAGLCRYCY